MPLLAAGPGKALRRRGDRLPQSGVCANPACRREWSDPTGQSPDTRKYCTPECGQWARDARKRKKGAKK